MNGRYWLVGATCFAVIIVGCRREEAPAKMEVPPAAIPEPTGSGRVPSSVITAEGLAEDIQDSINAGNWSGADRVGRKLDSLRVDLHAQGVQRSDIVMYDSAIALLANDIGAKKRLLADTAANHVSRIVVTMMSRYSPRVPIAVGFMDVAGRDAIYRSELSEWSGVDQAHAELQRNYDSVADHMRDKDAALDQRIRGELTALANAARAKDARQVKQLADRLLEEVDGIERTY